MQYSLENATGNEWLRTKVDEALREDLEDIGDITSMATVPAGMNGRAELICKGEGVLAGRDWASACGHAMKPSVTWNFHFNDGDMLKKGDVVATVEGSLEAVLICERTALNGLQRLSGIATMAKTASDLISATNAVVLDTRKTMPGWRLAEKYAVAIGGASNQRIGLFDEVLIKENHVEAAGGIGKSLIAVRKWLADNKLHVPIEIEVQDMREFGEALAEAPDVILLDNFAPALMKEAVKLNNSNTKLEASGGITFQTIAEVAASGVDRISLGALTHSVIPLDLSLLVRETYAEDI